MYVFSFELTQKMLEESGYWNQKSPALGTENSLGKNIVGQAICGVALKF
jgi:hypothetical protein